MIPAAEMANWFNQSPGKELLAAEKLALQSLLVDKFGYHALQLGSMAAHNWLENSVISHKIYVAPTVIETAVSESLYADFTALPFAPNSVDLVVVPHVLEFAADPKQILQEVYTALIPEGHVVILGYNQLSLWRLARALNIWREAHPWQGTFFTSFRVRRWLMAMDYWVADHRSLFFRPPLASNYWQEKLRLLEGIGQLLWPYLGAVFVIVAKKRVATPLPLRVAKFPKPIPVGQRAVEPSRLAKCKNLKG